MILRILNDTKIIPIRLMVSMAVMAIINLWLAYENEVDGIVPFLYIIGMIITALWTGLIFLKKLIGVHALYLPVIVMVISFVCGNRKDLRYEHEQH